MPDATSNNQQALQKNIMEEETMKEAALKALVAINSDKQKNHVILELCLPQNGDKQVRFCIDLHNGKTEYYLLKLDDKADFFIEYVSGNMPDLTPTGWKEIKYNVDE